MTDITPCNCAALGIRQTQVIFSVPVGCTPVCNDLELRVYSTLRTDNVPSATPLAIYQAQGIDADGIFFYVDDTINTIPGSFRFEITHRNDVISRGMIAFTSGSDLRYNRQASRC